MSGTSFRFRLERLRALRERREDAAKQVLAEALAEHRDAVNELERAHERVQRARTAQVEGAAATSTVADLVSRQAFLERAEQAVRAARLEAERREQVVEQRREQLREAARERQALERLKEHRRLDHERELARKDGLVLDEIAINGFRRRAA